MNEKKYVKKIVKKIRCGQKRRAEIERELLSEIDSRLVQGEAFEDIIKDMGSVQEIADSFNEDISEQEKRTFMLKRIGIVAGLIIVVLVLLFAAASYFLPKGKDITQSEHFDPKQVEAAMKQTVEWLDEQDYDSLKDSAIDEMKAVLEAETMEAAKKQLREDWGSRQSFGEVYMQEIVQGNAHYVVAEMTVGYENISVVYRLTYDEHMKLAGLYMR